MKFKLMKYIRHYFLHPLRRLGKKRWIRQTVGSLLLLIVVLVGLETPSIYQEYFRNAAKHFLSTENDWTPSVQRLVSTSRFGGNTLVSKMTLPVSGIVIKNFGWHNSPSGKQTWYGGIGIKAQRGEAVKAAASGKVVKIVKYTTGYFVTVSHDDDITSIYGNMASVSIRDGQQLDQGDKIGEVGSNEVYFEIRVKGIAQDPLVYLRSNREGI